MGATLSEIDPRYAACRTSNIFNYTSSVFGRTGQSVQLKMLAGVTMAAVLVLCHGGPVQTGGMDVCAGAYWWMEHDVFVCVCVNVILCMCVGVPTRWYGGACLECV